MKVLVISDTHGNITNVEHILEIIIPMGVKTILHCGDYIRDARRIQSLFPEVEVHGVYGNCDGMAYGEDVTKVVEIEDVSILMTHGHKYNVKWGDYDELVIDAAANDAKIALFGHSHCAFMEKIDGIWVVNPGSITQPRDTGAPSYAILDLEKGKIKNITILQILGNGVATTHPASKDFPVR